VKSALYDALNIIYAISIFITGVYAFFLVHLRLLHLH